MVTLRQGLHGSLFLSVPGPLQPGLDGIRDNDRIAGQVHHDTSRARDVSQDLRGDTVGGKGLFAEILIERIHVNAERFATQSAGSLQKEFSKDGRVLLDRTEGSKAGSLLLGRLFQMLPP